MLFNKYNIIIFIALLLCFYMIIYFKYSYSVKLIKFKLETVNQAVENDTSITVLNIDTADLNRLKKIIDKSNSELNSDKLFVLMEKQKTSLMFIVGILAALISIMGIYNVMQKLVEKSEHEKLSKLLNDVNGELIKLKYFTQINMLDNMANDLDRNVSLLVDETSKRVENLDEYTYFHKRFFNGCLNKIQDLNRIDNLIDDDDTSLSNYISAVLRYAKRKGYLDNAVLNVEKNKLFNIIIQEIRLKLEPKQYEQFKTNYQKIQSKGKINFGKKT